MEIVHLGKQQEWEALADRVHAPLAQRWLYGAAVEAVGREVLRLAVKERGETVAIAQAVTRSLGPARFGLITSGPLLLAPCDEAKSFKTLRRALPRLTVMTPAARYRRLPLSAPREGLMLDLTQDEDALRAALHGKWRNALKGAEQARLKVAQITATDTALMPILQAEKDRQAKGTYRGLPPEFTLAIQSVAPKSLRLFQASDAQMLFIRHGNTATYQLGHSGDAGRAANAHNLILWQAMLRLKAEGVERLDLGTIDRKSAPDLARFKARTGAAAYIIPPAQWL